MAKTYDKIVKLSKERKIPIYKIEKMAGIGNGVIRKWNDSNPNTFTLRKVAAILNVTIDDLINENE